ncbi:hypothetical protein Hypma_009818 [Hypsizygus marmoreus]|uniref:Uncharacterized protein n=1 Tax=Hypsizygus marmoreus TaxID=39966 RepID=A0A369JTK2_HYPMA|nr:hypothetical protein Hypma_009818 [Hypsizygus marmoreus]
MGVTKAQHVLYSAHINVHGRSQSSPLRIEQNEDENIAISITSMQEEEEPVPACARISSTPELRPVNAEPFSTWEYLFCGHGNTTSFCRSLPRRI